MVYINLSYILKYDISVDADWNIDTDALGDFLKRIEVVLPMKITTHGRCINRRGTHYARSKPNPHHLIILNPHRSAEKTNLTLLHEIAHAFQGEKLCPDDHTKFHDRHYAGKGYKSNPFEIHAKQFAKEFEHIKLVY